MNNNEVMNDFERRMKNALRTLPKIMGNEVLNFSLDNFRRQGFLGDTFQPWLKRKTPNKWGQTPKRNNRDILVNTGRLRRGGRIVQADWNAIVYGNDVPYASAHNDGLRVGQIQRVPGFQRRAKRSQGYQTVRAHIRRINQNIPRRRFIGESPDLVNNMKRAGALHIYKNIR